MKNVAERLRRLEKAAHTNIPVFEVTFDDGTTERMTIVKLALSYFRVPEVICDKKVQRHKLLRGDARPFHKLAALIGVEW